MSENSFDYSLSAHEKELITLTREKSMNYRRLMSYYRCALKEIETKFNVLDEEYSLQKDRNPINGIKTRLKSFSSIIEKLQRKHLEISVNSIEENLDDIAGIRIICSFVDDVYKLADALLAQDDIKLLEKKDYIQDPKENGYRSLHLIVQVPIFLEKEKRLTKVEIQLRTIAMDCWASLEHQLRYKKGNNITQEMQTSLFECACLTYELDKKMDKLREDTKI